MRHVIFLVGKDRYALPLDAVREVVVAPDRYTRVPHAGTSVKGVMTLRGRVVPVVDLARLLVAAPSEGQPAGGKVVLLELTRRDLGLLVTEVEGIEPIEQVDRPPHTTSRLVRGLTRVKEQAATVLDLQGLDSAVASAFATE
ncbi:MAG: purine-binding chemotaxis protein CheW [Archangium sp.]|nr:purine-binding chemotaxis protein CheW [Archangium sp.]